MNRYALIIGIAEYTGHFPSLETPVQNANAIADILDQYGEFKQVMRLPFRREAGQKDLGKVIRKPLTNETLVRELQKFLQAADGSEVLLYYSGHGFSKVQPLSGTLEGYLAPSDCQVELNVAGQVIAEKNGISLADLNKLINHHKFSSLVVILDCCNSGAFLESAMVRRDFTFGYERDYYLITACRGDSKAYEGEEYSLLTAAVLKGLSPASVTSGSGWISGDRLFDVVGDELQNSRQEPLRMGWGRSITLVRYEQRQATPTLESTFNPANPYMGLKAFEQHQADYFFGREQAVRALLDRLAENRFLAVIGPSGCGKSSLVKAGLLPELKGDRLPGSHDWQVEIITPGQYPLQVLTNALERHQADDKPVVLLVDQFEELFTLCPNEDDQRAFIKCLNDETNDPAKQTRIIVAMRGDFLDRCAKFQEAAELINSTAPTTYMVIPLTEAKLVAELEDSITCPAALHGVSFENGLVARIVDDVVNQPGAMPLLQYALLQLWNHCIAPDRSSRQLMLQSYKAIDGVKGALQRWADQFYTNLSPADQTFVQKLISKLVHIGDGNEVTRRRASWEELRSIASQDQLDRIIGRLVYQRLLVADDQTVEVAHEALLSESKLIQGWIEENRDSIRLQQRLEIYRREWQEHDRSENYLLDAGRLAAIDEWTEKKQNPLMPVDQEFIEKSRERRDRQFQAQLDQERKLREEAEGRELAEIEKKIEAEARAEAEADRAKESEIRIKTEKQKNRWSLVAILLLLGTAILSFNLVRQSEQREETVVTASIAEPQQILKNDQPIEALISSVNVSKRLQISRKLAPIELQRTVFKIQELNRLEGHIKEVESINFSPDGNHLVSSSRDNSIIVWEKNGELLKTIPYRTDYGVWDAKFSRSGKFIASADTNGIVKIWNFKTWQTQEFKPQNLEKDDYATSISFSEKDRFLAVAIANDAKDSGVIKIWDTLSRKPMKVFEKIGRLPRIFSISFSPKVNILAVGDINGNIRLLNMDTGKIKSWKGHKKAIRGISFSPNGEMFSTAGWDNLIKIWITRDGSLFKSLAGHEGEVNGVSFDSSGTKLASVSKDRTVRIWDVNTGKQLNFFRGHTDIINSVSFSPDGNFLASAGDDTTIRLWNTHTPVDPSHFKQMTLSDLLAYECNALKNYILYNQKISTEKRKICESF